MADDVDKPLSDLDVAYSPSSCLNDSTGELGSLIKMYRDRSERAKQAYTFKTIQYGTTDSQTLDYFPVSAVENPPLHIFIHGGYWQELSKDDSCFIAPSSVEESCAFVALNYTLAPAASIEDIVEECRQALIYLFRSAKTLGFDPQNITLSGSSAGAHLCAEMIMTNWEQYQIPQSMIKSTFLLSGIYDLEPIVQTYINDALQLNSVSAKHCSPLFKQAVSRPEIVVAWGEIETDAFKEQSIEFAQTLKKQGYSVKQHQVPGRNHFDIVFDLTDEHCTLGSWLRECITRHINVSR